VDLIAASMPECRLSWLNLSHNKITSVHSLCTSLSSNQTITHLNLSFNQLLNAGCDIALMLSSKTNIKKLSIKGDLFFCV
jgi:Leucine-rich repeat (LRR) protein